MSNKIKILPVEKPLITCYPPTAGLSSILTCKNSAKEWILSNYVQLAGYTMGDNNDMEVVICPGFNGEEFCPWITTSLLSRELVKNMEPSIIDFIIRCINKGYYIYTTMDEYYFSESQSGKRNIHFPHDTFIYGYDLENKYLTIETFTFKNRFSFEKVSFEEAKKAYHAITPEKDKIYLDRGGVALWAFFEKAEYSFDLNFVKRQMEDFLNGVDDSIKTLAKYNDSVKDVFGTNIYEALIDRVIIPKSASMMRNLHNIYEHKKLMLERLKFMNKNHYLSQGKKMISQYLPITNKSELLVSLSLKYFLTQDAKIIDRIINKIRELKEDEKLVLEQVVDNIV